LADRKQTEAEASKKFLRLPSWLRSDDGEEEEATLVREVKADEVDAKKGTSKVEVVPMQSDAAPTAKIPFDANDASLKAEVDQELKLRKEEERAKQSRNERQRLSNDFSSGLWTGGGGARAMMRQLEEADRLEKRASIQRTNTRSPETIAAETKKEESRPMGAVKDTIVKPFTVPRRLSDHALPSASNGLSNKSPSPKLQQVPLPAHSSPQQKKRTLSPSKEETSINKDREHRHPSPSLLIRRELSLGIPVHSLSKSAGSRASMSAHHPHPPTRTPSPRLIHPHILEDIAEVPSRGMTEMGGSGTSTPRRANTIGHSSRRTGNAAISANSFASPAASSTATGALVSAPASVNGTSKVRRASSLSGKPVTFNQLNGKGNNIHTNLSQHAQPNEGRFDQARHKARSSFKDLVARIKS
jgi:hypothetical protein